MNNEIKETLDILKKCYDLKDENFDNYITLYQLGVLLDYITQLTNNWNKLEEWLLNHYEVKNKTQNEFIDEVLYKMKEIKEKNK